MKFRASVVFALLCLVAVFGTAAAQDVTRGGLSVEVVDQTGAVIPGASVKIRSPQGELSASTDARGRALFRALIPGFYEVVVETTGFKTATVAAVLVRLNERSGVRVEMEIGTVAQTIEVIGAAVGIDLSTTSTGANLSDTLLTSVPVGRNVVDPLYLSPGVVSGGGTGVANPAIAGASGLENLYLIDGVNTTNSGFGGFGNYNINFGSLGTGVTTSFIKEIQVKTGGMEAQFGGAMGGVITMITKSGGNDFHGAVYAYFQPEALQDQFTNPNDFRNSTFGTFVRHKEELDYGFEVGGKIIQDHLFFFASLNPVTKRKGVQAPAGFLFGAGGASDLGVHEIVERTINYAGKLSYRLNDSHSVDASLFGDPSIRGFGPNRGIDIEDPAAFSRLDFSQINWTVRYNGAITPNWILSASLGQNHQRFEEQQLTDEYEINDQSQLDLNTLLIDSSLPTETFRGGIGNFENTTGGADLMIDIASTHLFEVAGVQNSLTVGFQFENAAFDGLRGRTGPNWNIPSGPRTDVTGAVGELTFGASLRFFSCTTATGSPDCNGAIAASQLINGEGFYYRQSRGNFSGTNFSTEFDYYGAYLQDDIEINKYLTFKLGMRWESEKIAGRRPGFQIPCVNGFGLTPAGKSPTEDIAECSYTFTRSWAPRIGFIIDPWGNRKGKVYFNYGRFFERIPLDMAVRAIVPEEGLLNLVFTADANLVPVLDQGHFLPASLTCDTLQTAVLCGHVTDPDDIADLAADFPGVNPASSTAAPIESGASPSGLFPSTFAIGTKMQFQDEYIAGFEYELPNGLVLGVRYQDRRIKRIVEDVQAPTSTDLLNGLLAFQFIFSNVGPGVDIFDNPTAITFTDLNGDGVPDDPSQCSAFAIDNGPGDGLCFTPLSGLFTGGDGIPDGFTKVIRDYRAVEITAEKRFTDNWQILANLRISKLNGNFEGSFRNDNGQSDPNLTSLFDFTSAGPDDPLAGQFEPGPLPNDRTYVVNLYGSYLFNQGPANGLNIGAGWRITTGTPITQFDAHPVYENAGELPIGGRGALGRTDTTQSTDVHADYAFQLTERFRLKAVVDIFNFFNNQRLIFIDQFAELSFGNPNPDFLTPRRNQGTGARAESFQAPLRTRFALRLEW